MKRSNFVAFLLPAAAAFAFALTQPSPARAEDTTLKLWYDLPAKEWTEALPIGNGRLGGMLFGGQPLETEGKFSVDERLQFNEDTFWAGGPYNPNREQAWRHLAKARELVFAGKLVEAH